MDCRFHPPLCSGGSGSKRSGKFLNLILQRLHSLVSVLLMLLHLVDLVLQLPRKARFFRLAFAVVACSSSLSSVFDIAEKKSRVGEISSGNGKGAGGGGGGGELFTDLSMDPAEMLSEIFLPREAVAAAPFAVWVWTLVATFGAAVLAVDFALVAVQSTSVGEAADLLAAWFSADVGPVVFISVFAMTKKLAS